MLPKYVLDKDGRLLEKCADEGQGARYLPMEKSQLPAQFFDHYTQRKYLLVPTTGLYSDPDFEKNLWELEELGTQQLTEKQKKEIETQNHIAEFHRQLLEKHPHPEDIQIGSISGHCKTPQRTLNWSRQAAPTHGNPDLDQGVLIGGLRQGSETITTTDGWQ